MSRAAVFLKNIYLAVPALSCGTLEIFVATPRHVGFLAAACGRLVAACGI